MDAVVHNWTDLPTDSPISLLSRSSLMAEQMLAARVFLEKGCEVKVHHHPSEQIAMVMSGRVMWTLGSEGRQEEATAGQVVHLPAGVPHGVIALEDTVIFDILSPPGAMGIDSQDKTAH